MTWNDTAECPVCGTTRLKTGMRNHIIGKAKSELWDFHYGLIQKAPHTEYVDNNVEVRQVEVIKLGYGKEERGQK